MKHLALTLFCLFTTVGILTLATGCQTSKGFGRDVENLGENIQKSAR